MPNQYPAVGSTFHALADPTRRAVVEMLAAGPASVSDLAEPFTMALPSFMQHLGVLEDSGLIRSHKVGRVRTCEIAPEPLNEAEAWISGQRRVWERRLDQLDDYVRSLQTKGDSDE